MFGHVNLQLFEEQNSIRPIFVCARIKEDYMTLKNPKGWIGPIDDPLPWVFFYILLFS